MVKTQEKQAGLNLEATIEWLKCSEGCGLETDEGNY